MNGCEGCCHYRVCEYFSEENQYDLSIQEGQIQAMIDFCNGCCCGDGSICLQDEGCMNYETEPIMG